jgi:ribosomal protein L7/L12
MLQEQFKNTLKQLILSQRTVDAIKLIRTYTGMGLQDSKELFDLLSQNPGMIDTYNFEVLNHEIEANPVISKKDLDESVLFEIKKLLSEGSKSYAVSYLREVMNIGLQNAEAIVREIEDSGKGTITFETAEVLKSYQSETSDSIQSGQNVDEKPVKKSLDTGIPSIPYTHSLKKKNKPISTQQQLPQPIVFAKMERRESNRKKNRSNSGCMVTLVIMIVFGVSLVWLLS